MTGRELHWKAAGSDIVVRIEESGGLGTFHIGDRAIPFGVRGEGWIEIAGRNLRFHVHRHRDEYSVWLGGHTYRLTRIHPGAKALEQGSASGSGEVRAVMPGKVLRLEVAVGDTVTEKQAVVIMESMKMESSLQAPKAGTVTAIGCAAGQVVEMGALLVTIE